MIGNLRSTSSLTSCRSFSTHPLSDLSKQPKKWRKKRPDSISSTPSLRSTPSYSTRRLWLSRVPVSTSYSHQTRRPGLRSLCTRTETSAWALAGSKRAQSIRESTMTLRQTTRFLRERFDRFSKMLSQPSTHLTRTVWREWSATWASGTGSPTPRCMTEMATLRRSIGGRRQLCEKSPLQCHRR